MNGGRKIWTRSTHFIFVTLVATHIVINSSYWITTMYLPFCHLRIFDLHILLKKMVLRIEYLCSPQKFPCQSSTTVVMVIWRHVLWEAIRFRWSPRGGTMMELVLLEEAVRIYSFSTMWGYREKAAICKAWGEPSPEPN